MSDQDPGRPLPRIPELEGEFELVRELGRGGTAIVYLARDRELGRDVAIKLIRPSYLQDEEALARLEREARTVGQLQHPNIVLLLGSRRLGTRGLALILQYVPGETLKEALRREGALPIERVRSILADVATGLAHAHRRRIVHRDIKPENVYLDEEAGVARLADFGIARAWDSDSGLTLPGTALGTPAYMSPEQVDGQDLDGRSDVYSLGLLAWEMLTGTAPWSGESLYNVIYKQKHEALPPLSRFRDDVPSELAAVLERALKKDPEARWRSAAEFLEAMGGRPSAAAAADAAARPETGLPVVAEQDPQSVSEPDPQAIPAWMAELRARTEAEGGTLATGATPMASSRSHGEHRSHASPHDEPQTETRSRRGWLLWGGAALALVVVGLLLQGPDAPLQTLLRGGNGISDPSLDWDRWERTPDTDRGELGDVAGPGDEPSVEAGDLASLDLEPGLPGVDPASGTAGDMDAPDMDPTDASVIPATSAPPGSSLRVVQGAGQTGTAGDLLDQSIVVLAEDADGARLPGVPVTVAVVEGGGTVTTSGPSTDAQGFLVIRWRLGPEGVQEATVRFPDSDVDPVELSALARPRAPELALSPDQLSPQSPPDPGTQPQAALPGVEMEPPSALSPRPTVAGGGGHSCLLDRTGAIRCWGAGAQGQLGLGDRNGRDRPIRIAGSFTRLTVGISHTCALDANGSVFCWGANGRGQLGDGTTQSRGEPTPVPGLPPLLEISAGGGHTCGLDMQGRALCWGAGDRGQLGNGDTVDEATPVQVTGNRRFRQITTGWNHTCALDTDGRAFCWGAGAEGQLGWDGLGSGAVPGSVQGGHRFTRIAAGEFHTCGVSADGTVLCWGQGSRGQLGDGTNQNVRPAPAPVVGGQSFRDIATGSRHTCALTQEGVAYCWGENTLGQVGDGTTQNRREPTPVAGNLRLTVLQALESHTCGLAMAGDAVCWGNNADGQIGDGSRTNRSSPTPVPGSQ
ncbi:MAG: hypothetical protein EA422_01535 [Gemmatimonadales bacterium]|nr:MAG: hypothetical protein EA422_01535 [Gemmatimonadales bacterium]